MKPAYYSVEEMIEMIDEPEQSACKQMLQENWKLFQTVWGSSANHQAWEGGYFDHIQEVMNIAVATYQFYNAIRPLPFLLSDALLVLFVHDIEKPWKYELGSDGKLQYIQPLFTKNAQHKFRLHKLTEYGINLTPEQEKAMRYVEGEGEDYSNKQRVMSSLGAFCHIADISSARIWFEYPLEEFDPWRGAWRCRA